MNKKLKLFLKIIYYVFTFGLGIILALILPGIFFYETLAVEMDDSLKEGKYTSAMALIGGYYDEEYVYQEDYSDGSGVVIFKAATLLENEEEDATQAYTIHLTYSVFLYNTDDKYLVKREEDNQSKVIITNNKDKKINIDILNHDSNNDGNLDTVSTMVNFNYMYFEVPKTKTESITGIEIVDREGNVFKTITLSLDFTDEFFVKLQPFVDEYNKNSGSSKLEEYDKEFLELDDSYKMGTYGNIQSESTKRATIIVLVYFIWIYVLGDFLVGSRMILRFFKWLIKKIRKQESKDNDQQQEASKVYGTDYYSKLTYKLIVPEGCEVNVSIKYHNENDVIEMIFTKDNDYTVTQRVHAGTYVNAWLECPGYEAINIPKTLDVKGYKMGVEVILNKIASTNEENNLLEDENENQN